MPYAYVCLLLDLLISLHFNGKFTNKLHCLHQLIRTPLFPHLNTLCLRLFSQSELEQVSVSQYETHTSDQNTC
jgi:hypothetical protein